MLKVLHGAINVNKPLFLRVYLESVCDYNLATGLHSHGNLIYQDFVICLSNLSLDVDVDF